MGGVRNFLGFLEQDFGTIGISDIDSRSGICYNIDNQNERVRGKAMVYLSDSKAIMNQQQQLIVNPGNGLFGMRS